MNNRHGVDVSYFENCIKRDLSNIDNYTPDELARVLARMSQTADSSVMLESEFTKDYERETWFKQGYNAAMVRVNRAIEGVR